MRQCHLCAYEGALTFAPTRKNPQRIGKGGVIDANNVIYESVGSGLHAPGTAPASQGYAR
jgi:hypothetical protein